jgi:predicted  nucleic acid-binding Zn-ribbon protein
MIDWEAYGKAIGAAVTGLVLGGFWMRTKVPRDSLEIKGNTTAIEMLTRLTAESARYAVDAKEAAVQRIADAKEIGKLSSENQRLQHELNNTNQRVIALQGQVERLKKLILTYEPRLSKAFDEEEAMHPTPT